MTKPKKKKKVFIDKFDEETETVISMANENSMNNRKNRNRKQRQTTKNYQKVENNNKKQIRDQNKRYRRMKKAKKIAKILLLFFIVIGAVVFALVSPLFNISHIQVEYEDGDLITGDLLSAETIVSLSQLQSDQNIFRFVKRKVESNIKKNPYVDNVEIKRKLPNTVEITVKERKRDYNLEFLNGFAYINRQGYILEISSAKVDGLPVIQGANTDANEIVAGNRLNQNDLEKMDTVIEIMSICKDYELSDKITCIDISNKNDYTLYMEAEKKYIHLGDKSNLNNKILYVPIILKENQGKEGTIYLNGDLNNNFKPYFREKV